MESSRTKPTLRKCFLSARFGTDTRLLEHELAARKLVVVDGRTLAPTSRLADQIRQSIANSDLVCVVAPESLSLNSAFEIGVAVGTDRQVIVFAPHGTSLPSDLVGMMYCRAALDDRAGISTFLDAFLAHGRSRGAGTPTREAHKLSVAQARRFRERLETARGFHLEVLVRDIFEAAGYVASDAVQDSDRGIDLAVWMDGLQHTFGNPVAVEVKERLEPRITPHVQEAIRRATERSGGRLGLLIYRTASHQPKAPLASYHMWPLVFSLDVGELLRLLELGTLERSLVDTRNRLVHGLDEV